MEIPPPVGAWIRKERLAVAGVIGCNKQRVTEETMLPPWRIAVLRRDGYYCSLDPPQRSHTPSCSAQA